MRVCRMLLLLYACLLTPYATASGQSNRDLVIEEMQSEQRIALVIGNGAYQEGKLRNSPNDARAIAQALRACDFQVVELIDGDRRQMISAIQEFGNRIERGGVGLFYYAGHGLQVDGINYLVPLGTNVQKEADVEFECVDAGRVLRHMEEAENRVNIVILDACRNNPFARSFRSGSRGLTKMDAARGTILAYATAPGDVAADGDGDNGLFTAMLLKAMQAPERPIEQVFKQVRQEVVQASDSKQVPWTSSSLIGEFYFVLPSAPATPAPLTPPPSTVQFGHLQVNVNAANSQVYVNGTYRGAASPGSPLNIQNVGLGKVTVKVTASGYQEKTQRFSLQANGWTQAVMELKPVVVAPPPTAVTPSVQPSTRPTASVTGGRVGETRTFGLPGGASIEMVWIEPGTFMMGSPDSEPERSSDEGPQHQVTISRGFWLGKYELTQKQWEAVMGTSPWSGQSYVQANASHPAVYISWEDVQGFIGKLNQAEGKTVYRLPTEAEWEYACRAGTSSVWPFGNDASQLGNYAWYDVNALNAGRYARPVGQKRANPWGLHDMLGNVYEWCQDWKGDYLSNSQTDPTGPSSGSNRVGRGGTFGGPAQYARPASRGNSSPSRRLRYLGVRLLRTH